MATEDFLLRASKMLPGFGDLLVYSVKINGQQHYRVAYGSYASRACVGRHERLPPPISGLPSYIGAWKNAQPESPVTIAAANGPTAEVLNGRG